MKEETGSLKYLFGFFFLHIDNLISLRILFTNSLHCFSNEFPRNYNILCCCFFFLLSVSQVKLNVYVLRIR